MLSAVLSIALTMFSRWVITYDFRPHKLPSWWDQWATSCTTRRYEPSHFKNMAKAHKTCPWWGGHLWLRDYVRLGIWLCLGPAVLPLKYRFHGVVPAWSEMDIPLSSLYPALVRPSLQPWPQSESWLYRSDACQSLVWDDCHTWQ